MESVRELERAYAAGAVPNTRSLAAAGAVASRYLAVGTPRSLAVIVAGDDRAVIDAGDNGTLIGAGDNGAVIGAGDNGAVIGDRDAALASIAAHRTWFDLDRCDVRSTRELPGARLVSLADALASDIVCIHAPLALAAAQLRRGTHVNALARVELDDDLRRIARVVAEADELPRIVRGLVDGRELDELTVFVATSSR